MKLCIHRDATFGELLFTVGSISAPFSSPVFVPPREEEEEEGEEEEEEENEEKDKSRDPVFLKV